MIKSLVNYLTFGDFRSITTIKNIIFSLFLKGWSIGISILLVPLTLGYLNQTEYGVWLTLSSILGWISFFDLGLGNGLRNKFAEAKAKNDIHLVQIYVSTTFALITIIMSIMLIIFLFVNPFLNWSKILNAGASSISNLNTTVLIIFVFFCLQFIFKIINTILIADQRPAISDLINVLGSFLSLCIIYFLTKFTKGSLLVVGITFSSIPFIVLFIFFIFLFNGDYRKLRPSITNIKLRYANDLMGFGFQFFILQITSLIIFTTSNLIITQIFGPDEVTNYNIVYKYFSITTMLFNIIIAPFWTAFTDAYHKSDFLWIKKSIKNLLIIWVILSILTMVMIWISNDVYKMWVGEGFITPLVISFLMGIYNILFNWNNIFTFFLNGTGKIRIELILAIFSCLLYIPLALYLGNHLGIKGVIISMIVCLVPGAIGTPWQYYKIIHGKASGIWIK